MRLVERIEDLPLELQARDGHVFAGDPGGDHLAQLRQRFRAQRLGELVVDLGLDGLRHLLDLDGEDRVLAGEALLGIVLGEYQTDGAILARLGADQALDEAGDEARLPYDQLHILALAALERLAADAAHEIDGEPVAVARGPIRLHLVPRGALGEARQALVDGLVGDIGHEALELERAEIGQRYLGQRLVGHGEGEIALPCEHALDLVLVLGEVDARLMRGALLALLQRFAARFLHGLLQHLGHHRAAVELLQVRHGHLALAEALELHLVLELVEARGEPLVQLALPDDDLELTLEPGARRLADLHDARLIRPLRSGTCSLAVHGSAWWCGRRDSNPHDFRHWNLNPARLPVPPRPPTRDHPMALALQALANFVGKGQGAWHRPRRQLGSRCPACTRMPWEFKLCGRLRVSSPPDRHDRALPGATESPAPPPGSPYWPRLEDGRPTS